MKTTTISVNIGDSDISRCFYILPPVAISTAGKDEKVNSSAPNDVSGLEKRMTGELELVAPIHTTNENQLRGHFIKQINVPFDEKVTEEEPFSCQMIKERFSETIAVPILPSSEPRLTCATFCNYESDPRCKASVRLEPTMTPSEFQVSMVCYQDCSKKRFRTTVNCCPRLKPKGFGETRYVQPKRMSSTYVSYVDYKMNTARQWHTSALKVIPKTACNNFIHGFKFSDFTEDDSASIIDDYDDLESLGSSGFSDENEYSPGKLGLFDLHLNDGKWKTSQTGYQTGISVIYN